MKKLITLAALCLLALASFGFTQTAAPRQWEYKQIQDFRNANALGAEGWELVAVETYPGAGGRGYLFKRQK